MSSDRIKPIAIYLPQFHPIQENDEWWGKGFTEWTNVTKAKPFFKGHYQPHLPTDLGFYDLRVEETRIAQAKLAKEYGIHGFCYYHYWFHGKRLLNRPVDDMLKTKTPNFPFMLFWANESWGRGWLGLDKEFLIEQFYSKQDDVNHISWLCEHIFPDERYIKINGRPAFIIYRPDDLPDYRETIKTFQEVSKAHGLPHPYLIGSNARTQTLEGFDHVLNFEPQLGLLPKAFNNKSSFLNRLSNLKQVRINSAELNIYDYDVVRSIMDSRSFSYTYLPCVFVSWDNSPRRGRKGLIVHNTNKKAFKKSLLLAAEKVINFPTEEKFVFINAWNEWAEGNHLEPCIRYGHQFLEAIKEVFS